MSKLLNYLNEGISDLHPYEPGRSIDEVVAEYKPDKVVKLASNENPLGPSPKAIEALASNNDLHLYPDGDSKKLKSLIADHESCLLYTSPSPRDRTRSRMPSSA